VELLEVSQRRDGLRLAGPDGKAPRVVLVDALERPLAAFRPRSSQYAAAALQKRGVALRLGQAVAVVDQHGVTLASGDRIPATAVIWAGGTTVRGTAADLLPGERSGGGRVVVGPDLSLPGHPEVFVVGDAAAVPWGPEQDGQGALCPQLAQVAMQSGRHAADQVLRLAGGEKTVPFAYRDKGIMATIGRRAGVAELAKPAFLSRFTLRGTVGWLAWLGLHLVYLIGFRNRLVVLVNWTWQYWKWPAGPRFIIEP
jgi:NADH dehydrogenase